MFDQSPFLFPEHPGPGRPHLRAEGPGGLCGAGQVQAAEVVDNNHFKNITFLPFFPLGNLRFLSAAGTVCPELRAKVARNFGAGRRRCPGEKVARYYTAIIVPNVDSHKK